MKQQLKVKVLDALGSLTENDIVKENTYKDADDGMVCFNGFVAELINGKKYEFEDIEQDVYDREYEYAMESYITDLWNEKPADVSDDEYQKEIDDLLEDFQPDLDTYSATIDEMSEMISEDLADIYEDNNTQMEINDIHYRWINNLMSFDVAVAEIERLLVEQE